MYRRLLEPPEPGDVLADPSSGLVPERVEPFEPVLDLTEEMIVPSETLPPPPPRPHAAPMPQTNDLRMTRVGNGWFAVPIGDDGKPVGKGFVAVSPEGLADVARSWGYATNDL